MLAFLFIYFGGNKGASSKQWQEKKEGKLNTSRNWPYIYIYIYIYIYGAYAANAREAKIEQD